MMINVNFFIFIVYVFLKTFYDLSLM